MGNCCPSVHLYRRPSAVNPKNVTLLLVGLDNAGKTTIAKRLTEEPLDGVLPTVGFSKVSLQEKGCDIVIYDLGGGPQIRDIWSRYYADVHGVIFVVDASDMGRMTECKKALENILLDSYIAGKPVLLLANKQDVEGALDEIDIVDKLDVERMVNQQKCPTLVELCSARQFSRKLDIGINNGYKWLLRCITKDYPSLNNRVLKDLAAQEEQERIKRAQREERIRKMREEREVNGILEGDTKPTQTHVNEKKQQNGIIPMVEVIGLPGQVEESSLSDFPPESMVRNISNSISYSCEFFKYEKDIPEDVLIKNMDERFVKNFLVRPKSSGPRINTRSDATKRRAPRRKSYQRNNKTAPSLVTAPDSLPALPKVFSPMNQTEVRPFSEPSGNQEHSSIVVEENGKESHKQTVGLSSKSVPNFRKSSANSGDSNASSTDHIALRLEKLPPIKTGKSSSGTKLLLDFTKLVD